MFESFKRNDKLLWSKIKGGLKEELYIVYPERYHTIGVATEDRVLASCIVVDSKGNYLLINKLIKVAFNTVETTTKTFFDKPHKVLTIAKGTKLFKNTEYIPDKGDTFTLFGDWWIKNGNIPFYLGYLDIFDLIVGSFKYTGGTLGRDIITMAITTSLILRDKDNNYARVHKLADIESGKVITNWVGLSDVNKGYKNLMSLIARGTNLKKGIPTATLLENDDETAYGRVFNS